MSLYGSIATTRPGTYLEIGAGNSTREGPPLVRGIERGPVYALILALAVEPEDQSSVIRRTVMLGNQHNRVQSQSGWTSQRIWRPWMPGSSVKAWANRSTEPAIREVQRSFGVTTVMAARSLNCAAASASRPARR